MNVFLLLLAMAQPRIVFKGFNDPQTLAHIRMAHLPPGLNLNASQRAKLRSIFLNLAMTERKVIDGPGSSLKKRKVVGALSLHASAEERAILSPRQFKLLNPTPTSRHR
jgi:hypothetical protein